MSIDVGAVGLIAEVTHVEAVVMAANKHLTKALSRLKQTWFDFIDTLVSGECGCHWSVTITYSSIVKTTCDPSETDLSMFGNGGGQCINETVDTYSESIDMPVFFDSNMFPKNMGVVIPDNQIMIMTTEANSDKLTQSDKIKVDSKVYEREGNRIPCGFDEDHQFYMMHFQLCPSE